MLIVTQTVAYRCLYPGLHRWRGDPNLDCQHGSTLLLNLLALCRAIRGSQHPVVLGNDRCTQTANQTSRSNRYCKFCQQHHPLVQSLLLLEKSGTTLRAGRRYHHCGRWTNNHIVFCNERVGDEEEQRVGEGGRNHRHHEFVAICDLRMVKGRGAEPNRGALGCMLFV